MRSASIHSVSRVAMTKLDNLPFPAARIMVFAKAPIPGDVKTRLIPRLGKPGAALLHERLTRHALALTANAWLCPVQLWCAPTTEHGFFAACQAEFDVSLHAQQGNDLGERMAAAFEHTLLDADYALVIGTDCPSLRKTDLREALTALAAGHDAVLGPAQDGGYVLLGLRRAAHILFEDIAWGGRDVLSDTRERLQQLNWRWHELQTHADVDRPEDLADPAMSGILADLLDQR